MAFQSPTNDPYRTGMADDAPHVDRRSPTQFDSDLQFDPEMREGPVSGARITAFAVAIVLVFAAVFYGMNATSTKPGQPAIATTQTPPPDQANTQPGVTTGAAPANPQKPENAPTGQQVDSTVKTK